MKLVCPGCGLTASAELWADDAATRQALALILGLPGPVREQTLSYLGLFRPAKRALAWSRVRSLATALRDLTSRREITWKNQPPRPVTPELWAQGMRQMIETKRGQDRFDSHGYLTAIVYDLANKADAERESRAHADVARHARARNDDAAAGGPGQLPEEVKAMIEETKKTLGLRR